MNDGCAPTDCDVPQRDVTFYALACSCRHSRHAGLKECVPFQRAGLGAAFIRNQYVRESLVVVGTDLVRVNDIADAISRHGDRYLQRIYTDLEIAYCSSAPHLAAERLAARFAAKEATIKLLRTDMLDRLSIEVRRDAGGWCDIVLHEQVKALAEQQGIEGLMLSMSHEHEYALATVVAQRITQRPAADPSRD